MKLSKFAAAALTGIMAKGHTGPAEEIAKEAWTLARAMKKATKLHPDPDQEWKVGDRFKILTTSSDGSYRKGSIHKIRKIEAYYEHSR